MNRRQIIFFLLLLLTIAATLVNSRLFVYQTLASYFLFTIFASIIILYVGLYFLTRRIIQIPFSWPFIVFVLWGVYIVLHGLIFFGWNLRYFYLIIGILFYISLALLFVNHFYFLNKLYLFIVLLAGLEAIVCILQFFEIIPSLNNYFKVTGTQVNPNITAMFLAMAVGPILSYLLYRKAFFAWIGLVALFLVIIALILLQCRTAYLGAALSIILMFNSRYGIVGWLKNKNNRLWAIAILVLTIGLSIPFVLGLYQSKQASADGRKTIWKIASQMIAQKPLLGYGYGLFERNYNLQQAKYFEQGKATSKEITNADFVRMAYCEPLENTVEGGIIGLFFFLSLIAVLLICYRKFSGLSMNRLTNEPQTRDSAEIHFAAYAGIVGFAVMSIGNFTIQAIPVMCLFLIYASIITSAYQRKNPSKYSIYPGQRKMALTVGLIIACIALYFGYSQSVCGLAHLDLKGTLKESNRKNTQETLAKLESLERNLKTSEGYYRNYGQLLLDYGNYQQALEELKKAAYFTSLPDMYLMMGLCNGRLGNYSETEKNFNLAMFMVPSRFAPKYYLLKLYQQKSDTLKTLQMAHVIAGMKIKIPSKEVDFYKNEAQRIIQHYEK